MLDTNNNMADDSTSSHVLIQMQVQLGEIKGILNTIVTEHARRITDQELVGRQLRNDLDAVKEGAKRDVTELSNKIFDTINTAKEVGNKNLQTVSEGIVTNKNHIAEIRTDIQEVKEKANGAWGRVTAILALAVSAASLIWQSVAK